MTATSPPSLFARDALLPGGWATDVRIDIDADGTITAVSPGAAPAGAIDAGGAVIPAMSDLHCHAFQRAMAGHAEFRARADDDFWSWREAMYGLAGRMTPESAYAVAAQNYAELLEGGYASVAEFHYVHRRPDGTLYANPAEMALAHVRAARDVGIAITLVPVVYCHGGFGARPLGERQRRFRASPDEALAIAQSVGAAHAGAPEVRTGIAAHSLRAVGPDELRAIVDATRDTTMPIHIHAAEQTREVDECVAWSGARPIAWLLEHAPIDSRWCLVHATHADAREIDSLAASGAVAGLCPTTEANLGDGLFPLGRYLAAGGAIGIGSDSNVSRSPLEELRLLEYGQRLAARRRNVAANDTEPSVGLTLWQRALEGGAKALGRRTGAIAPGDRADLLVLDTTDTDLAPTPRERWLDIAIFGEPTRPLHVMSGGRWAVRDGRHAARDRIRAAFTTAVRSLF